MGSSGSLASPKDPLDKECSVLTMQWTKTIVRELQTDSYRRISVSFWIIRTRPSFLNQSPGN